MMETEQRQNKAVIIGSGLGGLLTAAQLAKDGWSVEVYERLALVGGRFANIEYNGYKLSTGALHMVPHGIKGPLATMLRELGADFDIVQSSPMALVRMPKDLSQTNYKDGFEDISHLDFKKHLTSKNKLMMVLLTLGFKVGLIRPTKIGFKTWYSKYVHDDRIDRCADSFSGWALSTVLRASCACCSPRCCSSIWLYLICIVVLHEKHGQASQRAYFNY